jgi:hypothetical protein
MKNKKGSSFIERFRDILSDPNNKYIPRVKNAGKLVKDYIIMHNGIKIYFSSYYGSFSDIFILNRGVHEPQEERVFMKVLSDIPKSGTIIELGSYWAFYSMWFNKQIGDAKCYMIESDHKNIEVGKKHFLLNNLRGEFTQGNIGRKGIHIDNFVKEKNISFVDILHSDIQGYEMEMLEGAKDTIISGRIKYIFISTHSQKLHHSCTRFLQKHGCEIIASADFDNETFCFDGVLVARFKRYPGVKNIDIGNRSKLQLLEMNEVYKRYLLKIPVNRLKLWLYKFYTHFFSS